MVISPAVPAPKPGDPITAKWAADLAAAVNSCANPADSVGEVSTPFGKASPAPGLPMLGAARMPQPFDVALFRDEGESADTLYIWLPDLGADYVVYKGKPLPAAPGQTIGDANTAWVEVGSIASGAAHYIYLVPHAASSGEVDGWEITDTATAWDAEGGGTGDELPHVLLAYYNIAADSPVPSAGTDNKFPSGQNGLVQCRHGTIALGGTTTDTTVADESSSNTQNRSVDEREEDGALQIHDFDETLPSGTAIRKVELKAVADAGTGGRKLQLVDPDGNADFRTKWMLPLREAGTGGREIKWVCIGGEACLPVPSFTASVASGTGTPGVVVTPGGTECAPTVDLAFSGLQGLAGPPGRDGDDGCSPEISVTVLEPGSTQGGEAGGFLVAIQNYERSGGQCVAVGQLLTFVVKNGTKGEDGDDGCSPTVSACPVPTEHGDCACVITPCGEGATPITVYHGKNGENGADGCSPLVIQGSGNVACYIQPRTSGPNGCENDGRPIPVYNGAPGAGLSGTFLTGLASLAVTSAGLTLTANTATYVNGVQTATGTTSATVETTTC